MRDSVDIAARHDNHGVAEFEIRGEMIRLQPLLKAAGLVASGAEAKELIVGGAVTVNGETETRRGRQLHRGDAIALGDEVVTVA